MRRYPTLGALYFSFSSLRSEVLPAIHHQRSGRLALRRVFLSAERLKPTPPLLIYGAGNNIYPTQVYPSTRCHPLYYTLMLISQTAAPTILQTFSKLQVASLTDHGLLLSWVRSFFLSFKVLGINLDIMFQPYPLALGWLPFHNGYVINDDVSALISAFVLGRAYSSSSHLWESFFCFLFHGTIGWPPLHEVS